MPDSFEATYSRMTDEELFHVAREQQLLVDAAKHALALELSKRGLQPSSLSGQLEEDKQPATPEEVFSPILSRLSLAWRWVLDSTVSDEQYRGIRGWLQALILYLLVVNPLTLVFVFALWRAEGSAYGGLFFPGAAWAVFAYRSFAILVRGLGIYAGISMWRKWPGALSLAKLYFVLMVCDAVFAFVFPRFVLPQLIPGSHPPSRWEVSDIGIGIQALLFVAAFVYLFKSRRVSATFPKRP